MRLLQVKVQVRNIDASRTLKKLVLGFATNQDPQAIHTFVKSLRSVYSPEKCDLVLATNSYEEYFRELSAHQVLFLPTVNNYGSSRGRVTRILRRAILEIMRRPWIPAGLGPMANEMYNLLVGLWQHPHFSRWFCYRRFLTLNRSYSEVFLTDVKDVVFQSAFFTGSNTLSLFDQSQIYGEADCDTNWYLDAFGKEALDKVIGKPAICIGTIMGPHCEILNLVERLCLSFSECAFRGFSRLFSTT